MLDDDNDMVEINLSTPAPAPDGLDLCARESYWLTKSLTITDLKDYNAQNKIADQQKYATIGRASCKSGENLDSPSISCLRQMYCPECGQRLNKESVCYETNLACCVPFFPLNSINKCCLKRSIGRKVICNKCGSNLGYWNGR